ncbi:hypothetical protein EGW08_018818 [Elysia chlorotica]|uniref:BZIP domain-containing protein n=1 Tax=Elysia chlorotica TaxID=188477 RepID=A0A3S0ZEZ1_ELYCH|nr:hypothetical protein EGW08_018818 [Elysia chlorotica]
MSDLPRHGGGGRRRTQDEANLTHEEAKKKQKNREAAKKHREKKEKTLMALKKENEILEAKNEEYIEMQKKLKEFIGQAEKLIQQHMEAGCSLPRELQDWKSSTDQSLCNSSVAMEQSSSDSCASSVASSAVGNSSSLVHSLQEKDDALTPRMEDSDPMALFSGESLPPIIVEPSTRPQQRGRQCSGSPTLGRPLRSPQILLAHASSSFRRNAGHVSQDTNQTVTMPTQGTQVATSCSLQLQSHQLITFKDVTGTGSQLSLSSSGNSTVQQSVGQAGKTNILQVNGKAYMVVFENGHYQLVDIQGSFSKQPVYVVDAGSSIADDRGSMEVDASRSSKLTGNIPAPELLGDFEKTANELNAEASAEEDVNSSSYNGLDDNVWGGDQQTSYNYYINSPEPHFHQQEASMLDSPCYSYTDDLNLSETPQHILRQIQTQVFQQQGRESSQSLGSTAYTDSSSISTIGTKLPSAQTRDLTSAAPSGVSSIRQGVESNGRPATSAKTPVACAPAILDMLSESEVLPSLQNEIKESLSL